MARPHPGQGTGPHTADVTRDTAPDSTVTRRKIRQTIQVDPDQPRAYVSDSGEYRAPSPGNMARLAAMFAAAERNAPPKVYTPPEPPPEPRVPPQAWMLDLLRSRFARPIGLPPVVRKVPKVAPSPVATTAPPAPRIAIPPSAPIPWDHVAEEAAPRRHNPFIPAARRDWQPLPVDVVGLSDKQQSEIKRHLGYFSELDIRFIRADTVDGFRPRLGVVVHMMKAHLTWLPGRCRKLGVRTVPVPGAMSSLLAALRSLQDNRGANE